MTLPFARADAQGRVELRNAALVAGVVAVALWLCFPRPPYVLGAYGDDGAYTVLGKALAAGRGYRALNLPGAPISTKFPPGVPLVLALLWRIGGTLATVPHLVRVLNALLLGTTMGALYRFGRQRLGLTLEVFAVLVVLPLFFLVGLQYYSMPLAEPFFMLGWAAALIAGTRLAERPSVRGAVGLGILLGVTMLFRLQAVGLAGGILVALLWIRPRRLAIIAGATCGAILLAWVWWAARHNAASAGRTYWQDLPLSAGRALSLLSWSALNAISYLRIAADYVASWQPLGYLLAAGGVTWAVTGARRCWSRDRILVLSVLGNLAIVLVWPYGLDRLLVSMFPFVGLLVGARAVAALRAWRPARRILLLAAIAGIFVQRQFALGHATDLLREQGDYIRETAGWLRQHGEGRAMVAWPAGVFLYSAVPALNLAPASNRLKPLFHDPPGSYTASRLVAERVRLVAQPLVGNRAPDDFGAVVRGCPQSLVARDSLRTVRIYALPAPPDSCVVALGSPPR